MVTTSLRSYVAFAALLAGSAVFLASQQSSQSSTQKPDANTLVFRSTVNRVILDVVVTDAQGKPVRGLTSLH